MNYKHTIIFLGIFFIILVTSACRPNVNYIKRAQALEEGVSNPTTQEELADAIKKYEKRVEDILAAQNQIGIWYKLLGIRYLDNHMYGEAMEAFQKSITYHPDNQNLFYYVGVCAGYLAKAQAAQLHEGSRKDYIELAKKSYLRALELDNSYVRALYGLSVLYVFELDSPEKAIPLLEHLLTIDTSHIDALFLLARSQYVTGDFQQAADIYEKIQKTTKNKTRQEEAAINQKQALDALYTQ